MTEQVATRGEYGKYSVSELSLDPRNPRLPPSDSDRNQDELIELLARDYLLIEVGRSIADNGYFEEEPLAAVKEGQKEPPWTVIEGNRRLASLKLLTDVGVRDRLADKLGRSKEEWDELAQSASVQDIKVPVVMYDEREQLLTFMGRRHIAGVQAWEPRAKARFISSLIDIHGMDFQEAAQSVGIAVTDVRRSYLGRGVSEQARDAGIDTTSLEKSYGVFDRAMYNPGVKNYIGITAAVERTNDPSKLRRPVPQRALPKLGELVSWLAGSEGEVGVITDSRQLTSLGKVLSSSDAVATLRATRDLDRALEHISGPQRRLSDTLKRVLSNLESAEGQLTTALADDNVIELADSIVETAKGFRRAVQDAANSRQ